MGGTKIGRVSIEDKASQIGATDSTVGGDVVGSKLQGVGRRRWGQGVDRLDTIVLLSLN